MLLVVEADYVWQAVYRNEFATLGMLEDRDYVFARSVAEAKLLFQAHLGYGLTAVIVNHNLDDNGTGLDIVRAIRQNMGYDHISLVRCSEKQVRGYPESVPWYSRSEIRDAVRSVASGTGFPNPCLVRR